MTGMCRLKVLDLINALLETSTKVDFGTPFGTYISHAPRICRSFDALLEIIATVFVFVFFFFKSVNSYYRKRGIIHSERLFRGGLGTGLQRNCSMSVFPVEIVRSIQVASGQITDA